MSFAQAIALAIAGLELGLDPAAARVARQHRINERSVAGAATGRQTAFDVVGLVANETDIEHGGEA